MTRKEKSEVQMLSLVKNYRVDDEGEEEEEEEEYWDLWDEDTLFYGYGVHFFVVWCWSG